MQKTMIVSGRAEIDGAIEWIRENLPHRLVKNEEDRITGLLISEELMIRLFDAGCQSLTVTIKGLIEASIEITGEGNPITLKTGTSQFDEQGLEEEIRDNILSQYHMDLEYSYEGGKNICNVFPGRNKRYDLKREIFEYYEEHGGKESDNSFGVLVYIAKKHPWMFWLTVLNKTIKHLGALMLPVFASNIIDAMSYCKSFFELPILLNVLGSVLALTINLICATLDMRVYQRFTRHIESGFKMAIIQKLQIVSIRYYNNNSSGRLLSKLASDVQFVKLLLNEQITLVLHLVIDIIFAIIVSLLKLPVMLVFYAIALPAAAWIIIREMPPIMASKAQMRKETESSNASFKEMLSMVRLTRSHGLQRTEYYSIFSKVWDVQTAANKQDMLQVRLNNAGYGASQGFRIVCVCVAVFLAIRGDISVASVVLFLSLFDALINSLQKVLDTMPQITQGLDSLNSIHEVLRESDIEKNGTEQLPYPVRGEIEFKDVTFQYPDGHRPILDHVSFKIPAGTSAALIGKSGSGKSTLLYLLLGLYAKQRGQILIDGIDIDELEKSSYRRYIAVVPQRPILFSGTLWDNLVYGLKYVTYDQVMTALENVGLKGLVDRHPEGLMMPVYEEGGNLSGGQCQRIAIARALLRNPKIILLDEATSALDAQSEAEVQETIESIMGTCTIVIVAHRLNTIRKVDAVFKVEDDHLEACGIPDTID